MTNDHRVGGNFPQGGDKCFGNLHRGKHTPEKGLYQEVRTGMKNLIKNSLLRGDAGLSG
jgi:hypothetical protein